MDIRDRKQLQTFAAQRLEGAGDAGKIVLIFSGLILGSAALVALISDLIQHQIGQAGGLGQMQTRSMLSTVQSLLPIVQSLFARCLEIGYLAAMLRLARGQYASPKSLKLGFDRFWPLMRLTILQWLIFTGIGFLSIYLSVLVYMITPLSQPVMELLAPLLETTTMLNPTLVLDELVYAQLTTAMIPLFLLCAGVFCLLAVPVLYRYRMAEYVLIDRPELGALAVLRESRNMMRTHRVQLFRLDLSLWWFYLGMFAADLLLYADVLLQLMGVSLPLPPMLIHYLCYGLYLAGLFAVFYFLRNRAEVTYALAYDSLRPRQEQTGAVLGNIFQM